ncbi:TonB-dependent receptor [Mariniflexile litorale]|uniref:TonB-dependent receptor n=1 Tax=Mariniflexile litorale TaxID=3045158 RepID=A0AAU7ECF8_9FLAO|nr:TonB-dependent receptor [Mariniflexile sp. KMM 9835]MDQ8212125.1 TonB-dependent receptor [Mariniflexile sp. KMM 9835]
MKAKIILLLFFLFSASGFTQNLTVSGVVTSSEDNMPVPGVNVIVKGTIRGVSTDFDGTYLIQVKTGEILEFSSVGFKTVNITVDTQKTINISMNTDIESLEEVVLVGYGTQRKTDLTGSIVTIKSQDIEKTPSANVMQSLQGKVSGLQVISNGSPGDSPTVRLRGIGSYNNDNAKPLFVVDGMFYTNIDFLNSKDVESITVLKDASSSAIYGVRAANGVIIIKTKTGSLERKPQFEYDGYTGVQYAQNVLKLANAEQFSTMAYESGSQPDINFVLNAMQRYGRSKVNPNVPNVNTDWFKEILRPGIIQSHSIGATGGAENVSYSVGANYFSQEGILDMKNEYERFNIRSKIDVKLSDRFKIGINNVFSNATKYNAENGAWFQAYFAVPINPVFDDLNTEATPIRYSNAQLLGYRGTQNPFPTMDYNNNQLKIRKLLSSIFIEVDLIPEKLNFKSTYNHDFSALDERYVDLPYNLGNNVERISSITKTQNTYSNQIWDNVLTYNNTIEDHNLTLMAGTSYRDEASHTLSVRGDNIAGIDYDTSWYLNFAEESSIILADKDNNGGDRGGRKYGVSYFSRAAYNYKDKYLLYGTIRADGSSKFTKDPWGYFPSVGAGWVLSNEDFMKNNGFLDYLKLRASWGKLGNDNVAASSGSNTIDVISTDIGDVQTPGITSTSTFTDNTWEVIEEKNFGANLELVNRQLSIEADYYIRDTKNAIMPVFVPIINATIEKNSGEIRNQGLEVAINWNKRVSQNFSYSIGTNFTTLKNKTLSVTDPKGYIDAGSAEFRQRTIPGEPIKAFYGYQTTGVYQNAAQIAADPVAAKYNLANPTTPLIPGDLIYKDVNGDDVIDDADRAVIGSYLPKFMYGGNIGFIYKDFDFSLSFYGQAGNKILNRKRGEIIFTNDTNMDADLAINRWHGEGTSNSYPSSAGLRKGWNQKLSNFWIEDGDFFRIQNIQLGYTIKGEKLLGKNMPETRLTLTADRPFTFFNYNGFNPEVSDGIDRQTYPVPGVYTFGVNIKI